MILVDTSVLIDYLKGKNTPSVSHLEKALELVVPLGITGQIYQEVLQGAATEKEFETLKKYLSSYTFYAPEDERETFSEAARLFFECRKKGYTVRSTVDCLIFQIAREQQLKLLHSDRDFEVMRRIHPEVEFF